MTRVQQEVQPWVDQNQSMNQPVSLFAEFEDAAGPDEQKEETQNGGAAHKKWDPLMTVAGGVGSSLGWMAGLAIYPFFPGAFHTTPKKPKHRHSGSGLLGKTNTGIRPVSTKNPHSASVSVEEGTAEQKENNDTSTESVATLGVDTLPPPPVTQFTTNPALQYF